MKREKLDIINIQAMQKVSTISFLDDDVMVVDDVDIYRIPKPTYPVRMKYFSLVYCLSGSATITINTIPCELPGNHILVIPTGCTMTIESVKEFKAFFVVVSQQYMDDVMTQCSNIWKALAILGRNRLYPIEEGDKENLLSYIKKLSDSCKNKENKHRRQIVKHQLISMLHEICGICVKDDEDEKAYPTRNKQIYMEFVQLVIENFRKEHTVAFYADKLCITPKYLSMAIKEAEDKTPSEIIQRFLIQEAMLLLKSTTNTIKEISNELNFQNPSFFCRYFRKHVGISPMEYRVKPTDQQA